ncbi:unnamed protein product, partial [Gulo gulo]
MVPPDPHSLSSVETELQPSKATGSFRQVAAVPEKTRNRGPPGLCSPNKNTSAGHRPGARTCRRVSALCPHPHTHGAS